jgi:hypothetical protein
MTKTCRRNKNYVVHFPYDFTWDLFMSWVELENYDRLAMKVDAWNSEPKALINSHQFLFLRKIIMTKTVDKIPRKECDCINGVTFSFSNSIRGRDERT